MKDKPVYIKCPRCELNYILKKDKLCEVCKQEIKAGATSDADFEFEEDEVMELCPICKVNYLTDGEKMCQACLENSLMEDKEDVDWREYIDKNNDETDDESLDLLPTEGEDEIDEDLKNTFSKDLEDEDFNDDFDDMDEFEDSEDEDDYEDLDDYDDDEDDDDYEDDDDDEDY